MEQICHRAVISGCVQGVMFRASCAHEAKREKVAGYAKNLTDGSVEVLLEGDAEAVTKVLSWCRQGPPAASVKNIEINNATPANRSEFTIL